MKIYHIADGVQYWYDRQTRCWWAARFDRTGNQVGTATHAHSRREIEAIAAELSQVSVARGSSEILEQKASP